MVKMMIMMMMMMMIMMIERIFVKWPVKKNCTKLYFQLPFQDVLIITNFL